MPPATLSSAAPSSCAPSRDFSWSAMHAHRRAAAQRFGKSIFDLRIVRRVRDELLNCIAEGDAVLEVGAGERTMAAQLARFRRDFDYRSLDVDPRGTHDYRDPDEVERQFACVFALEVVEHLPFEEISAWVASLARLVEPGGCLVLSTPNTFYPPAYLRDATHRTPLCYDELAGLLAAAGLSVERVVRVYHDPVPRALLRRYAFGWLFRLLGIDFARQIVVVGRRVP